MGKDNTSRFSQKADNYLKYRPAYPKVLLELLRNKLSLGPSDIIADIGSGTGLSSEIFITNGNQVFAVEPNVEMRKTAEKTFYAEKLFISINGSSEETLLEQNSIDVIFSGQAFHWFDKLKSKAEFNRILKPSGHIVLSWNIIDESTTIGSQYQQLLKQNIEGYSNLQNIKISEQEIEEFFSPKSLKKEFLKNSQSLDLPGFIGRIRSSSLVPDKGEIYQTITRDAEILFRKYEKNGLISIDYQTVVYWY